MLGSIGFPELLVILTIALLIFGPKKLPEVGKSIGKALREFRRTSDEIKEKIEEEIQAEEFREIKKDLEKDIHDVTDTKNEDKSTEPSHTDKTNISSTDTVKATEEGPDKDTEQDEEGKEIS